ncbi:MAG: thiamine pyrophosphate-dependent enzyme [Pseudomonadota bacterium]
MQKEILLGDEAVALGAIHAGISGVYGYPGTPSTEAFEYVERLSKKFNVHATWSANEKVGLEEALGMSFAGKRSLVTMKHVGLNVAADPFMNSAITGTNGGLVILVCDDPGMHSSQNEQDTRYFADFGLVPCFEPKDQQEAYEMTRMAYDYSERHKVPIIMRLTTRLAHSRGNVNIAEVRAQNELTEKPSRKEWVLLPSHARVQYANLVKKQNDFIDESMKSEFNFLKLNQESKLLGIIVSGIATNYLNEHLSRLEFMPSILKISQYPLPMDMVAKIYEHCDELLVIEEGYPYIEKILTSGFSFKNKKISGKLNERLPRCGELNPDIVADALGLKNDNAMFDKPAQVPGRPPSLCKGCSHIDTYNAINEIMADFPNGAVFSDIGCYTLGALPPYEAIDTCIDMGASISAASGASHAGMHPCFAVIGDSTFGHSGMTPLLGAAYENNNITVFILDNETTAMTGSQLSIASGERLLSIIKGLGVDEEHLKVINPLPKFHVENVEIIKKEVGYKGLSVIVPRRACIQIKRK